MNADSLVGFISNGKEYLLYNSDNSEPRVLGINLLNEVQQALEDNSWSCWAQMFRKAKVVTNRDKPTPADRAALLAYSNSHCSITLSTNARQWYSLLYKCQGSFLRMLQSGYLLNCPMNGIFIVRYKYILDFDKNQLIFRDLKKNDCMCIPVMLPFTKARAWCYKRCYKSIPQPQVVATQNQGNPTNLVVRMLRCLFELFVKTTYLAMIAVKICDLMLVNYRCSARNGACELLIYFDCTIIVFLLLLLFNVQSLFFPFCILFTYNAGLWVGGPIPPSIQFELSSRVSQQLFLSFCCLLFSLCDVYKWCARTKLSPRPPTLSQD
jgi:hypothetical protein